MVAVAVAGMWYACAHGGTNQLHICALGLTVVLVGIELHSYIGGL